jgi:hypothetical protein
MLYSEIIAVCSEIHTKHINTVCEQKVEFVNVKPGVIYSNHWALTNKLMLYREIIAVLFWDPHKTRKYTVWAERKFYEYYSWWYI